jgi:hypothetical protein
MFVMRDCLFFAPLSSNRLLFYLGFHCVNNDSSLLILNVIAVAPRIKLVTSTLLVYAFELSVYKLFLNLFFFLFI